jgi:hypothetical protein
MNGGNGLNGGRRCLGANKGFLPIAMSCCLVQRGMVRDGYQVSACAYPVTAYSILRITTCLTSSKTVFGKVKERGTVTYALGKLCGKEKIYLSFTKGVPDGDESSALRERS